MNDFELAVQKFKKGRITRRELLRIIKDLILVIPSCFNNYDEDIRSEFFAFIMGQIEKMLMSYEKRPDATFQTWFSRVLKRKYRYFMKRKDKKTDEYTVYEETSTMAEQYAGSYETRQENYTIDLPEFTVGEQRVFMEKYGVEQASAKLVDSIIEKSIRRRKVQSQIVLQYYKIIECQKLQGETVDPGEITLLKQKEQTARRRKREYERKYHAFCMYPTNEWVARKLNISPGTVASYLGRIKKKIIKHRGFTFE